MEIKNRLATETTEQLEEKKVCSTEGEINVPDLALGYIVGITPKGRLFFSSLPPRNPPGNTYSLYGIHKAAGTIIEAEMDKHINTGTKVALNQLAQILTDLGTITARGFSTLESVITKANQEKKEEESKS